MCVLGDAVVSDEFMKEVKEKYNNKLKRRRVQEISRNSQERVLDEDNWGWYGGVCRTLGAGDNCVGSPNVQESVEQNSTKIRSCVHNVK